MEELNTEYHFEPDKENDDRAGQRETLVVDPKKTQNALAQKQERHHEVARHEGGQLGLNLSFALPNLNDNRDGAHDINHSEKRERNGEDLLEVEHCGRVEF